MIVTGGPATSLNISSGFNFFAEVYNLDPGRFSLFCTLASALNADGGTYNIPMGPIPEFEQLRIPRPTGGSPDRRNE
jgi:hypothetical protein